MNKSELTDQELVAMYFKESNDELETECIKRIKVDKTFEKLFRAYGNSQGYELHNYIADLALDRELPSC